MWLFRYKRGETIGTYNFGQYQVYVGFLSGINGEVAKGITVLNSDSIIEMPFPLSASQASALSKYLEAVAVGGVPKKHYLKGGLTNFFTGLNLVFTEFKNGALKGRISTGMLLGWRIAWVTVNPTSLLACSQALRTLYGASNA